MQAGSDVGKAIQKQKQEITPVKPNCRPQAGKKRRLFTQLSENCRTFLNPFFWLFMQSTRIWSLLTFGGVFAGTEFVAFLAMSRRRPFRKGPEKGQKRKRPKKAKVKVGERPSYSLSGGCGRECTRLHNKSTKRCHEVGCQKTTLSYFESADQGYNVRDSRTYHEITIVDNRHHGVNLRT